MNKRAFGILVILSIGIVSIGNAVTRKDSVIVLKPQPKYQLEVNYIRQILANIHYRKVPLSDSLSSVIFDNYFKSLDYRKTFFYSSDLDYFSKYRYQLDDDLKRGNVDVGFQIYRIFRDRANKRFDHIFGLIENGFDYNKEESMEVGKKEFEWSKNDEELNERWRKLIKSQALGLKLSGSADSLITELLLKRYRRYKKSINQNNSDDVFQLFVNSYTETLDPHTNYFSPPASANFNINMNKSLEGIGASLTQDLDYTVIDRKIPGGPAFKNKELLNRDKIIGVAQGEDGEFVNIIGWRLSDVVQIIRGPKGSIVRLQVIRGEMLVDDPIVVKLERDRINLDDQKAKAEIIPISEGNQQFNLGVITVPDFYREFDKERAGSDDYNSVTKDVKKIIEDFKAQNIDGLLIDLRYNGGGSLEEAIEMSGLFIEKGPIVQVKSSNGKIDVRKDEDDNVYYDGPLAVLTNRVSASASEIFSGAIQDYKRGIILGESTYGKGTVQTVVSLNRQMPNYPEKLGNLKLTLQMFYRVTGSSTQNIGVAADINFPSAFSAEDYGESSLPSALPWDKIQESQYEQVNNISPELKERLAQLYQHHLETDEDLKKLSDAAAKAMKNRDIETLSLNYEERKKEREKVTEPSKNSQNTLDGSSVEIDQELTVGEKSETEFYPADEKYKQKLKKDPYLKEGLRLLAEIVKFNIG